MRVLIINGHPNSDARWSEYIDELRGSLVVRKHTVEVMNLAEMVIADCQRCYGCWVKRPGECLLPDQSEELRSSFAGSEFVVIASPLSMGYPSHITQRALDRLLPLLLPYWESSDQTVRHRCRVDAMPVLGLLLNPEADMDSEDLSIIRHLFTNIAHQLCTRLQFVHMTDIPPHEVAYEIHRI